MNRQGLINEFFTNTSFSKSESTMAVNMFVLCIKNAFKDGHNVTLKGLGTFKNGDDGKIEFIQGKDLFK